MTHPKILVKLPLIKLSNEHCMVTIQPLVFENYNFQNAGVKFSRTSKLQIKIYPRKRKGTSEIYKIFQMQAFEKSLDSRNPTSTHRVQSSRANLKQEASTFCHQSTSQDSLRQ